MIDQIVSQLRTDAPSTMDRPNIIPTMYRQICLVQLLHVLFIFESMIKDDISDVKRNMSLRYNMRFVIGIKHVTYHNMYIPVGEY